MNMHSTAEPPVATGFAIVDLETTGLRTKSDRVVEIAIVRTDLHGRVLIELSTLIDPERAIDGTDIHGITSADVREAPPFRDVAGTIFNCLRGAILVSHNHPFDRRFLLMELERMGAIGVEPVGLCTMGLADEYLERATGRSLKACCDAAGVPQQNWHHALPDARAAAGLFFHQKAAAAREGELFKTQLLSAPHVSWPDLPAKRDLVPRELARHIRATKTSPLGALVMRLPAGASANPDAEAYLAKLDEVVEDRVVTAIEGETLRFLALDLGLASGDLPKLHFSYLRDVARCAVADRVVSPEERGDLELLAQLLGFPKTAADAALEAAERARETNELTSRRPLTPGMVICISENEIPKPELTAMAEAAGLVVRTSVSKKTDAVVTADPLSKSAKIEKARALGKRIIVESVFVAMVKPGVPRRCEEQCSAKASEPLVTLPTEVERRPGWYADPGGEPAFRYWDGTRWTQHVAARTK